MANDFYNHSGYPGTRAQGDSSSMRAQLAAIAAGFDKMPSFSGNANKLVRVNSGATALEATSAIDGITIGGSTPAAGAFTTLSSSGAAALASLGVTGAATAATARVGGTAWGYLGVRKVAAYGGTGPSTSADALTIESNATTGISILTPNSAVGRIAFGDNDFNLACRLEHNHATDEFTIIIPGRQTVFSAGGIDVAGALTGVTSLTASGTLASAALTASGSARVGGTSYGIIGLRDGTAYGGAGPNGNYDSLVVEGSGNSGISILTPNSAFAGYVFGDDASTVAGGMTYTHSTDRLSFLAGDTVRQIIDGVNGHVLTLLPSGAPTLAVNSQMTMHLTSNTNLRISVRGSDGTTRVANLTLA